MRPPELPRGDVAAPGGQRASGARGRLAVALVLAGVVLGPVLLVSVPGAGGDRSSVDRGPEGSAALAGVLRRIGYDVESLRGGLWQIDGRPQPSVLFLPSAPGLFPVPLTRRDVEYLEAFMDAGGTVVALRDRPEAWFESLGIRLDWDALPRPPRDSGVQRGLPVLPDRLALGAPLSLAQRGGFERPEHPVEVTHAVGRVPVVLRLPVGAGRLIAVADPGTASNSGLPRPGNLDFYVSVVREHVRKPGRVYFDDLHAGATDDHGVVAYARRSGFLPALLLALTAAGLYLWRSGSRFGSILEEPEARLPHASSELVHAVGGLYERAGLQAHGLAVIAKRFRRAVERRSGLAWEGGGIAAWVDRELGSDAGRDFETLRRRVEAGFKSARLETDALLALAQSIERFEAEWLRRRPRAGSRGRGSGGHPLAPHLVRRTP